MTSSIVVDFEASWILTPERATNTNCSYAVGSRPASGEGGTDSATRIDGAALGILAATFGNASWFFCAESCSGARGRNRIKTAMTAAAAATDAIARQALRSHLSRCD